MAAEIPAVYQKLVELRQSKSVVLKPCALIRPETKIRYYQSIGIMHLLMMKRFLLGDDTGIGKTLQTIASFAYLLERQPELKLIVAAPKSALSQWGEEIDKFTTGIKWHILNNEGMFAKLVTPESKAEHGGQLAHRIFQYDQFFKGNLGNVLILNYNPIVSDCDELLKVIQKPFVMCYDEATAFKSYASKTHDSCKRISLEAERVIGLTATMLKNNLMEGYGIYKVLFPPLFG